jgi:hypothetical protein
MGDSQHDALRVNFDRQLKQDTDPGVISGEECWTLESRVR